jgi:glycosyltransferase involved in cell wall biosynthesis
MGIDINLFKKRIVKKPVKYSKNRLLLFIGRLNEQKGLQYLIGAIPEIIEHEPNVKLLIIGEGEYKKTLQDISTEKEVNAYIEFLGALPHKDIAYYYNIADIFVMPSLSNKTGTESLGLVLLEAMASGCTVIGTNVGGIPYIIKNGVNGLLVEQKNSDELAKSIITLLKNTKKSEKLAKNASEFVRKNYSWEKVEKDFIKVYENVLK